MTITLERIDLAYNLRASAEEGLPVLIDLAKDSGGQGNGARPMQLLIMGLGGCSAMDVIDILKKQRQEVTSLNIRIEAEREHDVIPALWQRVHMKYTLGGLQELDKAQRAVELSITKYCSVAETLRRAGAEITWDVELANGH